MSSLMDYIESEQTDINYLKKRLEEINGRFLKFGLNSEKKLLEFLIPEKEKVLKKLIEFKNNLVGFKEQ